MCVVLEVCNRMILCNCHPDIHRTMVQLLSRCCSVHLPTLQRRKGSMEDGCNMAWHAWT
jgi:hypothetical protein